MRDAGSLPGASVFLSMRYAPELTLPPYTHVPGKTPHPFSDPRGHSFGKHARVVEPINAAEWRSSRVFLYAIDLFNHGFYWEAHEAWEALWHAAGRRGTVADFLKGLIQLAVAGVKIPEGKPSGVRSHAERATELFSGVLDRIGSSDKRFMGLDVEWLRRQAENVVARACTDSSLDTPGNLLAFELRPE